MINFIIGIFVGVGFEALLVATVIHFNLFDVTPAHEILVAISSLGSAVLTVVFFKIR